MQFVTIMFMVIIGAVIGWITNILAIKLLFRPLRPYKIPLLNYEIQGLLPSAFDTFFGLRTRRQAEFGAEPI